LLARILCVVFGLLGVLPLSAGFFARSKFAQEWASRETARTLHELLGVQASYDVELSLLPLRVTLRQLRVESTDGGAPALTADRIAITPGVFSLLAGRLDIGDIELDRVEQRLVIRDGEVKNLSYRLPETSAAESERMDKAPFRSLSATDARLDLEVDGVHVQTGLVDLDVFAERTGKMDVALRIGQTRVHYPGGLFAAPPPPAPGDPDYPHLFYDEDVICQLDARVVISGDEISVRRLSLSALADVDPSRKNPANCAPDLEREPDDAEHVAGLVSLQTRRLNILRGTDAVPWTFEGSFQSRAPLQLLNRATGGAPKFAGWAKLDGDLRYDGSSRLPQFTGTITTGEFWLADSRLAESSEGQARITGDIVHVPLLHARYGGGEVDVHDVTIEPFARGAPLNARLVEGVGVGFPAMIRDIGITPDTIVQWHLDRTRVSNFGGTLNPPKLDGDMHIETSRFELFNVAHHDPNRKHMLGVNPRAVLRGRFGVRQDSIQFNDVTSTFGQSVLKVTIHIGFDNWVKMEVPESVIHLADISPLVTVP
jgi:translocation and assembly module TamB